MNTNPYLVRFAGNSPSFVAPDMQARFENCLHMLATTFDTDKAKAAAAESEDFWPSDPKGWLASIRPYIVEDGLLQIPIKGVLLHDFPYQIGDWATGYDYIWKAFERGVGDLNVKGIALVIDSPGGDVAGNFDLVDKMFALRGVKPMRAYAAEAMYSAAYSVGSVADSITVSRTGGVGSIGVVTGHLDLSGAMKKAGVKYTFIFAGKHKVDGNAYQPLPASVEARMQVRIDALYAVFVATVARNRAMDEQAVRDTEALTFTAAEAVANGLADSIGPLDAALTSFSNEINPQEGDTDMADQAKPTVDQAAHEAAVSAARTEGHAAGHTAGLEAGKAAGIASERARVSGILNSEEAKTRPISALAFIGTDLSLESATATLAKLPEEAKTPAPAAARADPLAAAMEVTGGGAQVGAEGGTDDGTNGKKPDDGSDVMAIAKRMNVPGLRYAA
jgi:signal peptide peptidase SppA